MSQSFYRENTQPALSSFKALQSSVRQYQVSKEDEDSLVLTYAFPEHLGNVFHK